MGVTTFCQVCASGSLSVSTVGGGLGLSIPNFCFSLPIINGMITIDLSNSPLIAFLEGQGFDIADEIAIALPPFDVPCASASIPFNVGFEQGLNTFSLELTVTVG